MANKKGRDPGVGQVDPASIRNRVIEVKNMKPADLKGNDGNFRLHPAFQRKALKGSLTEVGISDALKAYYSERNGGALTLVDGHLRREDYGQATWPVLILDINDREADKLLLYFDAISALAELDADKLDEQTRKVDTADAALMELAAKMRDEAGLPSGEDSAPADGSLLALVDVTIGEPRHQVADGDIWQVGPHVLIAVGVFTDWPIWTPFLDGPDCLFAPYPGPFIPLTLKAEDARLVMVQPDTYVAGHILDQWANVRGEETVKQLKAGAA